MKVWYDAALVKMKTKLLTLSLLVYLSCHPAICQDIIRIKIPSSDIIALLPPGGDLAVAGVSIGYRIFDSAKYTKRELLGYGYNHFPVKNERPKGEFRPVKSPIIGYTRDYTKFDNLYTREIYSFSNGEKAYVFRLQFPAKPSKKNSASINDMRSVISELAVSYEKKGYKNLFIEE